MTTFTNMHIENSNRNGTGESDFLVKFFVL